MYAPDPSDSWQEYLNDLSPDGPLLSADFGDPLPDTPTHYFYEPLVPQDGRAGGPDGNLAPLPSSSLPTLSKTNVLTTPSKNPPASDQPPSSGHSSTCKPQQSKPAPAPASGKARRRGSPPPSARYPFVQSRLAAGAGESSATATRNSAAAGAVQFMPIPAGSNSSQVSLSAVYDGGSPYTAHSGSPLSTSSTIMSTTAACDLPRRDAHMASEQRRRAIMRESFERLQKLLPPCEYRKPSKANLLQAAVNYIFKLKEREQDLAKRIVKLTQENFIINQQIHGSIPPYLVPPVSTKQQTGFQDNMPPLAPSSSRTS